MRGLGSRIFASCLLAVGTWGSTLAYADWVIGQVGPFTGASAVQTKAYAQGMRLYFDQVNRRGGVHGERLKLVTADDRGVPETTVEQTRTLLQDYKPVALAGYFGNRNLRHLLDSQLLAQHRISVLGFQSTDMQVLNAPQMFSTRAGLPQELEKIARHLATLGLLDLALVYDDREPEEAQALEQLVRETVANAGARLVTSMKMQGHRVGQASDVDSLQKAQPYIQAIIVVASSPMTAGFLERYRLEGGAAQIYAISSADIEQLAVRLPVELMRGVSIAQVVPNPYRSNNKLNKEFRDLVRQNGGEEQQPVSYAMMEGFVNAKVLVEAMRRSTAPLTAEQLSSSLRSLGPVDLGGYWVDFRPGAQEGSKFVDLSIVNAQGRVTQ